MDDRLQETRVDGAQVFDGVLLKVYRDHARLPDGGVAIREFIRHPGAVAIVAVFDDGSVLLERQFRYPCNQVFIEIPAGKIDPGESAMECAARELREETGYVAERWRQLGCLHPCIGYSDETIEVWLAEELRFVGASLDSEEFIETFQMKPADALAAASNGGITDAKSVIGLYWAAHAGALAPRQVEG